MLEVMDDLGGHTSMFREVVIQAVRPGNHQRFEPSRRAAILLPQPIGVDEQSFAQIAVDGCFTFRLRQPPQTVEIIAFDPIEIVFGLRVCHAEYRVRIGFAVNMRDTPIVANDVDVPGALLPSRRFLRALVLAGSAGCSHGGGEDTQQRNQQ
jgi:hypothetical protein